ncbi:PilZ domain-containing protein [Pseudorhodoplanes sp.]|uniref:PilZ domain-containing protein n=1 Tax=Pseudorhodoplanes sp. TaxID=1934341 RepID=UPI002B77F87F|nr:PilZ domain-containing protein [Pseudorhodoplanes sp.]HWV40699.1 PilZ domain-containing protein [Pseudorhodoplanes sp.]
MLERRKSQRQRTSHSGSISFGVAGIVDCAILDMSHAGACLEFEFRPVLPKGFSVIIKPDYIRRSCRLVWQSQSRVGVEFVRS